ncbi:MAG: response regulator [Candidatus Paceibacterota bacterium]|jgi:CheY-like chemotaxis protein
MSEKYSLDAGIPVQKPIENKEKLPKVLLAEDNESVRVATEMMLEMAGYETEVVENGKELLDRVLSGGKINFIVTDNEMPEMDGLEAIKLIRNDSRFASTPIIMHSGSLTKDIIDHATSLRVVCLGKPYSFDDFEEALKRAKALVLMGE